MPLVKKPGKRAFSANVSAERAAGKPIKQALAIAYRVGGERDSKMAEAIKKASRHKASLTKT